MTIEQFTKSHAPVTIVANIGNPLAIRLAKILVEQGSRLLIVDKMTPQKRKLLGDLLNKPECLFMDSESTFRNISKFQKIDYVYYFLSHVVNGSTYPEMYAERMETTPLAHKDFLKESNRVDAYLKLSVECNSVFTLITSATVAQFLEHPPESNIQLQKYAESLVIDYVERNKANARIIRVGELIGTDFDLPSPTNLARLTREVILRKKVNVFGDGLQQNYVISTEDAVYGVLKATFSNDAIGRTYLVAYPHPLTSLGLAYQLLELTADEKEVVFNEVLPRHEDIAKLKDMCLAPLATSLGFEPQISLEQALNETMEAFSKELHQPWQQVQKKSVTEIVRKSGIQEEKAEAGEKKLPEKKQKTFPMEKQAKPDFFENYLVRPLLSLLSIPESIGGAILSYVSKARRTIFLWLIALTVITLVGIVATPYIHFIVYIGKAYVLTNRIKSDFAALESKNMATYSISLTEIVNGLQNDYNQMSYLANVPFLGEQYIEGGSVLSGYASYAKSAALALEAGAPAIDIAKGMATTVPNQTSGKPVVDYYAQINAILQKKTNIMAAAQEAQIGRSRLDSVQSTKFIGPVATVIEKSKRELAQYETVVTETAQVYDLLPYLLGYKERRNYFIMLQNETEIRSTGGWFTTYAIIGLENGAVRELTVEDVYNTDGKIIGVKPPASMAKSLGVKDYKLSLSNWSPELQTVSADIETLLGKTGVYEPNDLTATVNFKVIQSILSITGPITVDSLGEISASNVYDKVGELHSQFVPGSQNKTKVLADFMPKFLQTIANSSADKKQEIIKALLTSVENKDIMIYAKDYQVRTRLLDVYHTYTSLQPVDSPILIVDWNWGGNKANRYVKRITDITINEQNKKATVKMTYTNESKTDNYPQGTYVNVQRIYYPVAWNFSSSDGYETKPFTSKNDLSIENVLQKMTVGKGATKSVSSEFNMKQIPAKSIFIKQSGEPTEVIRVSIVRNGVTSIISSDSLTKQGYTETSGKWFKSYLVDKDFTILLR